MVKNHPLIDINNSSVNCYDSRLAKNIHIPEMNQSVIYGVKVYNKNLQVIEVGDKLETLERKLKLSWWID